MNGNVKTVVEPKESLTKLISEIANVLKLNNHRFKITEKFGKGENYLGEIQRAVLEGSNKTGDELVFNLLIKTAMEDPNIRKQFSIESFYKREIFVYKVLLNTFDDLQDKCNIPQNEKFQHGKCLAATDEINNETIIFEDLNAKGYKMYDRLNSLDYDHLMLMVKNIARFHALSFAAKSKLPKEVYDGFTKNVFEKEDMGEGIEKYFEEMNAIVVDYLEDKSDREKFKKFINDDFMGKFYKYINTADEIIDDPYYVITHGDFWVNNMLFKYENNKPSEMMIVDWQVIKYASPITDLAYMLFCCTDEDIRVENWNLILDTYYNTLRTRITELNCDPDQLYPEEVFKQNLKEYLGFGLITAVLLVPLVLNKREDSVNFSDVIDENGMKSTAVKHSEKCVKRLQGVIRHCAKLNII